jgi:hypothetical protein
MHTRIQFLCVVRRWSVFATDRKASSCRAKVMKLDFNIFLSGFDSFFIEI